MKLFQNVAAQGESWDPQSWAFLKIKMNKPSNQKPTPKLKRNLKKFQVDKDEEIVSGPIILGCFSCKMQHVANQGGSGLLLSPKCEEAAHTSSCLEIQQMVWWEWLLLISQYSYICMYIYTHLWVYIDIDCFSIPWYQKATFFGVTWSPRKAETDYTPVYCFFWAIPGIGPCIPHWCPAQLRGLKGKCKV